MGEHHGARIGVPRDGYFGYSPKADAVVNQAIDTLRNGGAIIVDPVKIPNFDRAALTAAELIVLQYEFKAGVNAYIVKPFTPEVLLGKIRAVLGRKKAA